MPSAPRRSGARTADRENMIVVSRGGAEKTYAV
jgi:hypothetical protein